MRAVIFTDLNCPFCYATEQRLDALGLSDRLDWRGVEHEPQLPVPLDASDEEVAEEVADEVAQVQARAPEVPISVPAGKPNTGPGLLAVAAALRADAATGLAFRQSVYRAFWRHGHDISEPAVLAELARAHGLAGLDIRHQDELEVASWRLQWERSSLRGVPLLVREDGETVYGLKDSPVLEEFLRPNA